MNSMILSGTYAGGGGGGAKSLQVHWLHPSDFC